MKRLHAARLEIVRDADISLLEMTSAALDWYRRPSRVGQNGVFLEARGLVKAADAQAEGSRKTDKGEPAREATLTSQGADNLGGSAPQERDSPGPSDSDFDEIDFLSPRRHHKDEPVRLPVSEPGGAKAARAQWQPTARRQLRSYKERKPAIIKHLRVVLTGKARCQHCIRRGKQICGPGIGSVGKRCLECRKSHQSCNLCVP
ncbi:hypothetical protein C8Q72DRAFT_256422 [Fomitopsis betulina]|nr:hypothetical protein C8Q72DRAFT_256422 [Fomitopsis betulina]